MILPDVNLILHAYNADSPVHHAYNADSPVHHAYNADSPVRGKARDWWEGVQSRPAPTVGLAWAVALGYIRISTHPRIMSNPLAVDSALAHVEAWLAQPQVALVYPGERHAVLLFDLLRILGMAGSLTTDAHLAALAMEYQATLCSTDADFGRFPGLRWENPLAEQAAAPKDVLLVWGQTVPQGPGGRIQAPFQRVNELAHGKRAVTPSTARHISRLFGTTAAFWMHAQLANLEA